MDSRNQDRRAPANGSTPAPESTVALKAFDPFRDWLARLMDPERLAVLAAASLAGAGQDGGFDPWSRLAARLLRAPVALISFIDDRRQILKSFCGLGEPWASQGEAPLSHSLCKYVVAADQPLALDDVRQSPHLRDSPGVKEGGVVAYLGVPLRARGETLGTFCVFDVQARSWLEEDITLLEEFARSIETQIALSLANAELAERERVLDSVLNLMPTGVVLRDLEGKVLRTNNAVQKLLGRSESELLIANFGDILHPDDADTADTFREELLSGQRGEVSCTQRCLHRDGHVLWIRVSAAVLRDQLGGAQGTIAVIEDVTAEREAAAALARQAHVYQAIAQNIPRGAVLMFDRELRYLAADGPELFLAAGLEKNQLQGHTLREVASPENYTALETLYRKALTGDASEFEAERNGRHFLARIAPIREGDAISSGLVFVQEVTQERRQHAAFLRSKALFETTIAHIQDGVALMDSQWNVLLSNRAFAQLFGLSEAELAGLNRERFLAHVSQLVEDPAVFKQRVEITRGAPDRVDEVVLSRPRRRVIRRTRTALELPDGSGTGYLAIWQDITELSDRMSAREREALCDALTGIPNRRAAELAIARALDTSALAPLPWCVALIDADHFKRVNDEFGHAVGDEVLKGIAGCLYRAARTTDTVARWGGEEFIAVVPVALEGATAFCERIRSAIEATTFPGIGRVTVSIGVAQYGANESAQDVIDRADRCLYSAKSLGRNRIATALDGSR